MTYTDTSTDSTAPATRFAIMEAAAKMPGSCMGAGSYRRLAVVEYDPAALPDGHDVPAMISTRARGMVRIVQVWDRLHRGTTPRSAYGRALAEAQALCDTLNAGSAD
jgi:hypothetical protein